MMLRTLRLRSKGDLACAQLVEAVTDFVEGTMSVRTRARFERHLAACAGCQEYLVQLRRTIELTGKLSVDDVAALSPEAREQLLEAFRELHTER